MSEKYTVNQVFMSLSNYYLEDGRHLARLHRRRRRRRLRAYAHTSNTASHDDREKINSWVSFSFLYGYGTPLGGPSGRRSSAIKIFGNKIKVNQFVDDTILFCADLTSVETALKNIGDFGVIAGSRLNIKMS